MSAVILIANVIVQIVCFFFLFRILYVHNYRMKQLGRCVPGPTFEVEMEKFNRLPSHGRMIWSIFRFDWQDYLDGRKA